jgi:hypothetical protein
LLVDFSRSIGLWRDWRFYLDGIVVSICQLLINRLSQIDNSQQYQEGN